MTLPPPSPTTSFFIWKNNSQAELRNYVQEITWKPVTQNLKLQTMNEKNSKLLKKLHNMKYGLFITSQMQKCTQTTWVKNNNEVKT